MNRKEKTLKILCITSYKNISGFQDESKINCELLIAADKYNIHGLLDVCAGYLEENLSLENGLDIMISVSCEQSTKTIV